MAHKRQIARAARHARGDFDERKNEMAKSRPSPFPFNTRFYFTFPESGCVRVVRYYGNTPASQRVKSLLSVNPRIRIKVIKNTPLKRWVKPEHPIALRRRLRAEREGSSRSESDSGRQLVGLIFA